MLTVKNVGVREIILNRPKKFNALNLNMVERITPEIQVRTIFDKGICINTYTY